MKGKSGDKQRLFHILDAIDEIQQFRRGFRFDLAGNPGGPSYIKRKYTQRSRQRHLIITTRLL